MADVSIWSGTLEAHKLNYSQSFSNTAYLYCIAPDRPDWSVTGDFIEVDCALLVTVAPGIQRQVSVPQGYISTREPLLIPEQLACSNLQLVLDAGIPVLLEVWAVPRPDVVSELLDWPDFTDLGQVDPLADFLDWPDFTLLGR